MPDTTDKIPQNLRGDNVRWRLGLDVGTDSVGAVAVELDDLGKEISVPWHLVRIFQEPNEKRQTGLTPKKDARRLARQQRRQLERRLRRVRKVAHLASLLGLDRNHVRADGDKGRELPELRAMAARERVDLPDLLRIFLRMAKRRGYAVGSGREMWFVQQGSSALQKKMAALSEKRQLPFVTLGEFLRERIRDGLPGRLKVRREGITDLVALRKMLEDEFDHIWGVQQGHHPIMRGEHKGRAVKDWFREALFNQRPLKSASTSVGLCPLEKNLPRAPRAQMAAQRFRIEKTLTDLRWGVGAHAEPLADKQREILRHILDSPELLTNEASISFQKLYKILEEEGCPAPEGRTLNLDRASREELRGNTTLKAFSRLGLLERWLVLDDKHQTAVINLLADLGSPKQLDTNDWHQKFLRARAKPNDPHRFRRFASEVIAFVDFLRNCKAHGRLTDMGFEPGRMAYSVKALSRLSDWLRNPAWREAPGSDARVDEDAAVRECYTEALAARESRCELEFPPKTGNDTVDVALAQVHWVIKDAIRSLGSPPAEIIVEFGREVGLGAARRNEWENRSAKNQLDRRKARDKIVANGHTPTSVAIRRYLHWQEQSTHCPYCSQPISLNDALDGHKTHVDHIIPRVLTQVGRKRSELVIAHASCNSLKGDRTPWQAFGGTDKWAIVEERAKEFEKKEQYRKARLLRLRDFEQEALTDSSIAEFVDRQLHQTSWIARVAARWLQSLCPNVFAARGEFTAMMRRSWRLDTVIPEVRFAHGRAVLDTEGNRISRQQFDGLRSSWEGHGRALDVVLEKRLDHRHHVINALVIALCSRRTYVKLVANYKAAIESRDHVLQSRQPRWQVEPPLTNIRATALRMVRECRVSHKPDRFASGKYFQDTAYSEVQQVDRIGNTRGALAVRTLISKLADEKSLEKTRKNIDRIVSSEIRDLVRAAFEQRLAAGDTPKQALSRPVHYPRYGTEIRHTRVIREYVSLDEAEMVQFKSRGGIHTKLLLPNGHACVEVSGTGKWIKSRVLSLHEAARTLARRETDGVRRFFKCDTVIDRKDGTTLVVKQIWPKSGGLLVLVPVYESRPVRNLTWDDGLRKIGGSDLNRLVLTNVIPP